MTATTPVSPGRKALDYAENVLGVNAIYEGAIVTRNLLNEEFTEIAQFRDDRRLAEQNASDRELELLAEENGKHPEMSVAAMERHMKLVFPKDDLLQEYRSNVAVYASQIEGVEYDIRIAETDIRIAVARMTELGGLLNYLAVIKSTASEKPKKPENVE